MTGEDKLREWLKSIGFYCALNGLRSEFNECNWYACRRSKLAARACECNYDKPGMQIVVYPHAFDLNGARSRSVEVEVCGEAGDIWWELRAYSINPDELPEKLDEIEKMLVSAWNALLENKANDTTAPEEIDISAYPSMTLDKLTGPNIHNNYGKMKFEEWHEKNAKYMELVDIVPWCEEAWHKARQMALQECADICREISIHYGTLAEGKEEPEFSIMLAKEGAAKTCMESINRKLLLI